MKFSTFIRHIREGFKSIIRNGWMSFASISSMVISLFILGIFLILALNLNQFTDKIENQVQIRVFLKLGTDEAKITELQNKIGNISDVKKLQFVSKEEGLNILRESLGDENKDILDGYENENNPLPDSFTIEVYNPQAVADVAAQIETINKLDSTLPVDRIKYGQGTVETLFKMTNAIRNIGLVIVIGLSITAMLLISTTIKMTIIARRREIGIMKLVGATNAFIRWPFFIEGALIGFISSIFTAAVVLFSYSKLIVMTQIDLSLMMVTLIPMEEASKQVFILLVGLGTLIGIWGSTISVRKYLKV